MKQGNGPRRGNHLRRKRQQGGARDVNQRRGAPSSDRAWREGGEGAEAKLPHERDEAAESEPPGERPLAQQAYRDLNEGQTDTDLRQSAPPPAPPAKRRTGR